MARSSLTFLRLRPSHQINMRKVDGWQPQLKLIDQTLVPSPIQDINVVICVAFSRGASHAVGSKGLVTVLRHDCEVACWSVFWSQIRRLCQVVNAVMPLERTNIVNADTEINIFRCAACSENCA